MSTAPQTSPKGYTMKWILPSEISGTVTAPPSKSLALRTTAAAVLSRGRSIIHRPSFCDDALAGLGIAESLGSQIRKYPNRLEIGGSDGHTQGILDCRESGLCMRMFAPIVALRSERIILKGTGSLNARPMELLKEPLAQLGVVCITKGSFPPVEIQGPLQAGRVDVDGSLSSQLLTGLLLSLPVCRGDSEIRVHNLQSRPYVAMTLDVISHFGVSIDHSPGLDRFSIKGGQRYRASEYTVEGDWSGAAFLLVAGAIAGHAEVKDLRIFSSQADLRILQAFESAGARIERFENRVSVQKDRLQAFQFDARDCPDLFPPLAVLASQCAGTSEIYGVERIKHKESDRAQKLTEILTRVGIQVRVAGDRMQIKGGRIKGGEVEAHGDHRMAMAAAVAGLVSQEGIGIRGWQCVAKSFPAFFKDLESLGGNVL